MNEPWFCFTSYDYDAPISEAGWATSKFTAIRMDKVPALTAGTNTIGHPTLYQGIFNVGNTGDTFLDLKDWGKGIVFINGINIGRYWKIGPQQTLYLPGCWLKKGINSIVVLDQLNDKKQTALTSVTTPVLDAAVGK